MTKRALFAAAGAGALTFLAFDFAAIANGVRNFAITSCSSSAACIGGDNTGAGPGASGESKMSNGVVGSTTFASTKTKSASGVYGEDLSKSGSGDSGVFGTSQAGIGVLGNSATGVGGVYGQTFNPSETTGTVRSGVVGNDASTDGGTLNVGVFAFSSAGTAVVGSSISGPGVYARGVPALTLVPSGKTSQSLLLGFSTSFANTSLLDSDGNLHLSGKIYTAGSCSVGCAVVRSSSGKDLVAYHPRDAAPTLEDVGTGRIVAGRGIVTLDPAFAATLDGARPYLVFVTPRGDSRGLFVARADRTSFEVRENQGGHSSLAFDYRIVGKPLDTDAARLPEFRSSAVSNARAEVHTRP
jgi:hypothetical protein